MKNESRIAEYRKAIAAVVGAVVLLLASSGVVIDQPVVDLVIAILTAFAVYRLPNAAPAGGDPLAKRGKLP